jgi:hypothetical protein
MPDGTLDLREHKFSALTQAEVDQIEGIHHDVWPEPPRTPPPVSLPDWYD